jgi:hypothetical protein
LRGTLRPTTLRRQSYRDDPVRSRSPLVDPEHFYRNYVEMKDDPETLDRKALFLTFLYKFARHESVGISAAWDGIPTHRPVADNDRQDQLR